MARTPTKSARITAIAVPVLNEVAAFGRSIFLAQILGADELGRAMMLALSLRLVEMVGDLSIERLMSVSSDGNSTLLQANLQGAIIVRGLFMSLFLLLLALPFAEMLTDGPALISYCTLALVPLVRAGMHLDYRRWERNFNYRGLAIVDGGGALVMLTLTPVLAFVWGDHRAIVGIFLGHSIAQVALSHVIARRKFFVRFDRSSLKRVLNFGAPLVANAVLMFLTFQADRLIVAGFYTWSDVAIYAVALQLAMLPAQIIGRAAGSLLTPRLRIARDKGLLTNLVPRLLTFYGLISIIFLIGYGLTAGVVIPWVYGASFATNPILLWCLGAAAAGRILRTPLSQLAVVTGRTADPARSNLWRAGALAPALGFALAGAPLASLAAMAAIGEAAASVRAMTLLRPQLVGERSKGA
jgi:O-antigen/teichoic acid export membrane protein